MPHIQYAETDVAVIGAGVGGCIAALALAPHYSVTLVDQYQNPAPKAGECLPPAALRILKQLDLTSLLEHEQHLVSHGMVSYWGSDQPVMLDNLRNPDGLGWHVDRQRLETALRRMCEQRGVTCNWETALTASEKKPGHWLLNFSRTPHRQLQLKAHIVIDATGRSSVFARQQEARRELHDKLTSCWMTFYSNSVQQMGLLCPDEQGWWYSAPIPNKHEAGLARLLSFQSDSDLYKQTRIRSSVDLLGFAKKQPALKLLIDEMDSTSIQFHGMVAANTSRSSICAGRDWYAIGDAAMSFDPLSSQGMFNAMATAMQLCDLIVEFGTKSLDIRNIYSDQLSQVWRHYQRHKNYYYSQERRWNNAAFWRRRINA